MEGNIVLAQLSQPDLKARCAKIVDDDIRAAIGCPPEEPRPKDPCVGEKGHSYSACKKNVEKALNSLTSKLGKLTDTEFEELAKQAGLQEGEEPYDSLKTANKSIRDGAVEKERPCLSSEIYQSIRDGKMSKDQFNSLQNGELICKVDSEGKLYLYNRKDLESKAKTPLPCSYYSIGLQGALKAAGKCVSGAPKIVSISPSSGIQGETIVILISGSHLPQKGVTLDFGSGITIEEVTTSEFRDAMSVKIKIAPDAELGKRNVKLLVENNIILIIENGFKVEKRGYCDDHPDDQVCKF